MSIKFIRKNISETEVQYLVSGLGLGFRVTATGIEVLGGTPAFDDEDEERAWKFQTDCCIILHQLIKQGAKSLPDESGLQGLATSMRELQ
jgi:hypothetical protein